jgi:hypothetical protein
VFTFRVSPIYPHEAPKVKCKTKVDLLILCSLFVLCSVVDFYYGIFIDSYGLVASLIKCPTCSFIIRTLTWKAMSASTSYGKIGNLSLI